MGTKTLFRKFKWLGAKIIWFGVAILLGICVFTGVAEFSRGITSNSIFIFVLTFMVFSFITFIHEMGHALAAWACKCRVHYIAVGRFGFDPENRKFKKHSDKMERKFDGFIQYSPSWPAPSRWTEIIVSFSGPLITLILGLGLLYRFYIFGYNPAYPNANTGYMWLGFACVLHTIINLLPVKISETLNTDGRNIWNSCWASCWTLENWMESRAHVSSAYGQEIATDEEWLLLRCRTVLEPHENTVAVEEFMQQFAWAKTDPETFMAVIDNGTKHIAWLPKSTQYQYVASAVLIGKYKPSLSRLVPEAAESEADDPNDILWHFAAVLKAHAEGGPSIRLAAVSAARKAYVAAWGAVGAEEEAIFYAVETGTALPPMKWPELTAEVKPSVLLDTAIGALAVA